MVVAIVFGGVNSTNSSRYSSAFLLTQVGIFAITYSGVCAHGNNKWYFGLFWLVEAINAVLGFKIIHEIFLDVFRPYHSLKDLGTPVFKWAGLVMLLVSVVVAASNSFDQDPVVHAVLTLQRSVRLVQFGLILFLDPVFALSWEFRASR